MARHARVRQLYEDGTALVVVTDICNLNCHQCGGCSQKPEALIAQNPQGAQPGELVQIRVLPGRLLLAALVLYVLPIALFFAGYWAGTVLYDAGKWTGCIALGFGIAIAVVYDRMAASGQGSGYVIIPYSQNISKRG